MTRLLEGFALTVSALVFARWVFDRLAAKDDDQDASIPGPRCEKEVADPASEATAPLNRIVAAVTVDQVAYDRVLLHTCQETSLLDALSMLPNTRSSGLFVTDALGHMVGVVDVADATVCLLQGSIAKLTCPVQRIISPCGFVREGTALREAITVMQNGLRYVMVGSAENDSYRVISPGAVVRFLRGHLRQERGDAVLYERPLHQVFRDRYQEALRCVRTVTARQAFKHMLYHQVRSVLLTDEGDDPCGVMSLSDIKCLTTQCVARNARLDELLDLPVLDFLAESRRLGDSADPRPLNQVLSCSTDASVVDVIEIMASHDVHNVYVEQKGCIEGVISVQDIVDLCN